MGSSADAAIRALRSAANLLEEITTQRRQRAAEATANGVDATAMS